MKAFAEQPKPNNQRGRRGERKNPPLYLPRVGILDPEARAEATSEIHEKRAQALAEQQRKAALQRRIQMASDQRIEAQNAADQERIREFLGSDPTHPDREEYEKQVHKRNIDHQWKPAPPKKEQ